MAFYRLSIVIGFLLTVSLVHAEPIRVGLFYGANHVRVTVVVKSGTLECVSEGNTLFTMSVDETMDITSSSGDVNVFYQSKNYSGYQKLRWKASSNATYKIQPAGQKPSSRVYDQNLIAFPYSGRLQLVNEIEVERYVGGVIEAESGSGQELEYYKVQAVISRTYALNNLNRHAAEGYQLCDATHCQVYHGTPRIETKARLAAEATKDIVIVDHEISLITAAFHSNCGGKTVDADAVWSKPVHYLAAVEDSFCTAMPHAQWKKTVHASRWNEYLDNNRNPLSDDTTARAFNAMSKVRFYEDSTVRIPMKVIREDFKLRSALFRVECSKDSVTFIGRGFGHGVGLCQEGAMRMATLGKAYDQIIHFYYQDVHLIPRYMMWFYKDE